MCCGDEIGWWARGLGSHGQCSGWGSLCGVVARVAYVVAHVAVAVAVVVTMVVVVMMMTMKRVRSGTGVAYDG